MSKRYLYYTVSTLWGLPGVIITAKGLYAYTTVSDGQLWWLLIITVLVLTGFTLMFHRIVHKYSDRIESIDNPTSLWQSFPPKGWFLIAFMATLGMTLKFIGMSAEFTSSFYCGLGPALVGSAVMFVVKSYNEKNE